MELITRIGIYILIFNASFLGSFIATYICITNTKDR